MSFKLSLLLLLVTGSAFWLLSWLSVDVAAVSVGVAVATVAANAAADDAAVAAVGSVLGALVVDVADELPTVAAALLSPKLIAVAGNPGPSVVASGRLLVFLVGIAGLALLSSVIRISVGLVISLMVIFQLKPAG